ncbi:MAG: class I SAM-dependent methyltransferase [Steroidobacter sp.]
MKSFKDHFSSHAAGYAAYRPTYPAALVDYLGDVAPAADLALDCGCGTGQLSVLLADRFARVVATDASAQQIANAQAHERVEYRTAAAEQSGLDRSIVDLVTVAQAAHWFALDRFYAEVRRVAKPNAVFALITYGVLHLDESGPDSTLQNFYSNVVGDYWPPERRHVEAGYRSLPFPFEEFKSIPSFAIEVSWSLADLVGYVDTWSAVRAAEKALGRAPIETFHNELMQAWGDPQRRLAITWPLSLRVGRVDP